MAINNHLVSPEEGGAVLHRPDAMEVGRAVGSAPNAKVVGGATHLLPLSAPFLVAIKQPRLKNAIKN